VPAMRTVNARAPLEGVMEMNHETKFASLTGLRRAIIATLAVLTIQGWDKNPPISWVQSAIGHLSHLTKANLHLVKLKLPTNF